jgi:hypothetical protein
MQIQEVGVYHLKDLKENHLSLQTIGTGGQFLLSGIDRIKESYRTPQKFYDLVCQKEIAWIERKRKR